MTLADTSSQLPGNRHIRPPQKGFYNQQAHLAGFVIS
jgi:hypothetical protein